MDSHEIALALGQQLEDLLAERRGFLGPLDRWHRARVGGQHSADTLARHIQQACDLAFPYSLRMQLENRRHARPSSSARVVNFWRAAVGQSSRAPRFGIVHRHLPNYRQ